MTMVLCRIYWFSLLSDGGKRLLEGKKSYVLFNVGQTNSLASHDTNLHIAFIFVL